MGRKLACLCAFIALAGCREELVGPTVDPPPDPPPIIEPPPVELPGTANPSWVQVKSTAFVASASDLVLWRQRGFGVGACDFNRDGYPDLVRFDHTGPKQQIYQGGADGKFRLLMDPGYQRGYTAVDPRYRITSTQACTDLDGDGFPEMWGYDADGGDAGYIENTSTAGGAISFSNAFPRGCRGAKNRCDTADFNGDGTLEKVTGESIGSTYSRHISNWVTDEVTYPSTGSRLTYPIAVDLDGNGWPDIAYLVQGMVFWNERGTFTQDAASGLTTNGDARSVRRWVAADLDNDGDLDLLSIAQDPYENSPSTRVYLFRNNGDRTFTNVVADSGIAGNQDGGLIGGTIYSAYANLSPGDYDLDGDIDVLMPAARVGATAYLGVVLRNVGGLQFVVDTSPNESFSRPTGGEKDYAIFVDYDLDGDVDIFRVGAESSAPDLLRNDISKTNLHWLGVRVTGPGKNTGGLHTALWVWDSSRTQRVTSGYVRDGMNGQNPVNLGLAGNSVVDIQVVCPNSTPRWLDDVAADRHVTIDCTNPETSVATYTPGNDW